jgi:hypothetical protein
MFALTNDQKFILGSITILLAACSHSGMQSIIINDMSSIQQITIASLFSLTCLTFFGYVYDSHRRKKIGEARSHRKESQYLEASRYLETCGGFDYAQTLMADAKNNPALFELLTRLQMHSLAANNDPTSYQAATSHLPINHEILKVAAAYHHLGMLANHNISEDFVRKGTWKNKLSLTETLKAFGWNDYLSNMSETFGKKLAFEIMLMPMVTTPSDVAKKMLKSLLPGIDIPHDSEQWRTFALQQVLNHTWPLTGQAPDPAWHEVLPWVSYLLKKTPLLKQHKLRSILKAYFAPEGHGRQFMYGEQTQLPETFARWFSKSSAEDRHHWKMRWFLDLLRFNGIENALTPAHLDALQRLCQALQANTSDALSCYESVFEQTLQPNLTATLKRLPKGALAKILLRLKTVSATDSKLSSWIDIITKADLSLVKKWHSLMQASKVRISFLPKVWEDLVKLCTTLGKPNEQAINKAMEFEYSLIQAAQAQSFTCVAANPGQQNSPSCRINLQALLTGGKPSITAEGQVRLN